MSFTASKTTFLDISKAFIKHSTGQKYPSFFPLTSKYSQIKSQVVCVFSRQRQNTQLPIVLKYTFLHFITETF